ncbi:MAG: Ger(x)C family spore germination protein [Clostridium sp.]
MGRVIRSILITILLICFTIPLYGCWDYIDSKDISYVAGMSIDKKNNKYNLTYEIIKAGADGKSASSEMISSEGDTIHAALRDVVKKSGTRLQLSHMKVIIVSENIAGEGIGETLDLINRDVELRNDMWILVAKSLAASDILDALDSPDDIVSFNIDKALSKPSVIGKYVSSEIFTVIEGFKSPDKSVIIPLVQLKKGSELNISGGGVFRGDKMVGTLSEEELLMLNIIRKDKEADEFVISVPVGDKGYVGVELMDIKRKFTPGIIDNKPTIDIDLHINLAVSEVESKDVNLNDSKCRDKLTKNIETYITENIYSLMEQLQQEYNSDVVGIGSKFKLSQNKELQKIATDWDNQFKNLNININTRVNIRFTGLSNEVIGKGD